MLRGGIGVYAGVWDLWEGRLIDVVDAGTVDSDGRSDRPRIGAAAHVG